MILKKPTETFISEILDFYSIEEGDELNKNLLKLFQTFNNEKDKFNVLIKVAALNKIYSTAITNINPVVEQIIKVSTSNLNLKTISDYIEFADNISKVKWENDKGESFERNNLSFASKYIHFLSGFKTPIYDSYIWIIINGYLGQKNSEKISYTNPKNYKEFYSTFERFKRDLDLEKYSNYKIDKFLWQYGKMLIRNIENEMSINLDKAKSELKKRIKASR